MSEYYSSTVREVPRIPLTGLLHLTYRCNFNCRHCWLRIPPKSPEKKQELSTGEIKGIVDQARSMGCRKWMISGGEPMLRDDFVEIFDYITGKASSYSLNTNGSLITPEIAKLMRRKGSKMIALYGATPEVSDHITRQPGSFEATMQGMNCLKEASASFIVQIIPMKDNYHQLEDMIRLAKSLSPNWRIGASWLYLSARGDPAKNSEILGQRLDPKCAIELDKPDIDVEEAAAGEDHEHYCRSNDDRLFASCIANKHRFNVDPYGKMTFCSFIKDSALRYDLRAGSFREAWQEFIPSLADKVLGGADYLENCGSCNLKSDCKWCPVYGYLEHKDYSAKVEYLCDVARERSEFLERERKDKCRYYRIGGITLRVLSDLPISDTTFDQKFKAFEVEGPGDDNVTIRHHFALPNLDGRHLGEEVYHRPPWAIYKKNGSWIYLGISPSVGDTQPSKVAVFNSDYTKGRIYNDGEKIFRTGGISSLTLFPTDQILLARLLADRNGCFIHSSGVVFDGRGLLFVGHSEAGKSTMVKMLKGRAEILCDDRIIVRKHLDGIRVYGTWSHGEVADVSSGSAPLNTILFLQKDRENKLMPIERSEAARRLLGCVVKPFVTEDWWNKTISLLEELVREVPCYTLHFDRSGQAVDLLKNLRT